jgi:hypothetical protein
MNYIHLTPTALETTPQVIWNKKHGIYRSRINNRILIEKQQLVYDFSKTQQYFITHLVVVFVQYSGLISLNTSIYIK